MEGARKDGWWNFLIKFYENPENQSIKSKLLEEALEESRKNREWFSLINSFYKHKENQSIRLEILEEALKELIKYDRWFLLLNFYRPKENQSNFTEIDYLIEYSKTEKPLSLLVLENPEKLLISLLASFLNIEPVIKSWNFNEKEKEEN